MQKLESSDQFKSLQLFASFVLNWQHFGVVAFQRHTYTCNSLRRTLQEYEPQHECGLRENFGIWEKTEETTELFYMSHNRVSLLTRSVDVAEKC